MKGLIGALLLFTGAALRADDLQPGMLRDGIALVVDNQDVELRVASPHAFRLHILPLDAHLPRASIYLSDKDQPATPFVVLHKGAMTGIKTDFGALLVDARNGTWSLRDKDGKALTGWAPLGSATQGAEAHYEFTAGTSARANPRFYGSGNIPVLGSLTQSAVQAAPGNGTTGLPQYWSSAGYGALLVGQNDNMPGGWKAQPDGSVQWTVPGTSADLYLMPAPNLYNWLHDDAELTGFAPVPPRWAFGYMQSRWGWQDKAYIDDTFAHFRRDRLPVDVFILDFEWYTTRPDYQVPPQGDPAFVDFNWNPALLPDPAKQIADFARQGLRIVGIRKPRLGNADNLALARGKGWLLPSNARDPVGSPSSRDLDFSQAAVRAYWETNNRKFLEAGLAAFWNDEGETNETDYHYWNMAEVDLLQQVRPGARFWSINRSFGPGLQRFGAAVWTGDIAGDWKTLGETPGELLSYGLSGMPYSACDIGGYYDKGPAELVTRWMEAGIFFPVMRSHSERTEQPHFPWLYGTEAEAAIRQALDLRYRLIPYYYSLAHETWATGAPLMRPLVMEFPADDKAANATDEWLMGKGLLAAPVLNEGGTRNVYLPDDLWFKFGTAQTTPGPQTVSVTAKLDEVPLYVRAGTLLPLGPVLSSTTEVSSAPLELQVYPGHDATFTLVEDDGSTQDYQAGALRTTTFSWNDRARTLRWKVSGSYAGPGTFQKLKVVVFLPKGQIEHDGVMGHEGSMNLSGPARFLDHSDLLIKE